MAKIFCIEFPAVRERHTALVSIYTKGQNACYHIQFTDNYLKNIFLTEHLRYEGEEGYKSLDIYRSPFTRNLLLKVVGTIHKTIGHKPAMIRWLFPFLDPAN